MPEIEIGVPTEQPVHVQLEVKGLNGHETDALILVQTHGDTVRVGRTSKTHSTVVYDFDIDGDKVTFKEKDKGPRTVSVDDFMSLLCSAWQIKQDKTDGWIQVQVATTPNVGKGFVEFREGAVPKKVSESSHTRGDNTVWTVRFSLRLT